MKSPAMRIGLVILAAVAVGALAWRLWEDRAGSAELHIAVAANFAAPLESLLDDFGLPRGDIIVSVGSTGKLYAQIVNGAPYDVFLAADSARPARLAENGFAVADSRFTYARGRLVLWSPETKGGAGACRALLDGVGRSRLAIANPETAPYGLAARQTLARLGLWDRLSGNIIRGENIGQAYTFVRSGNAKLGFVAASQMVQTADEIGGCRWTVPAAMHDPLDQQAVLLTRAANHDAARAFLSYLGAGATRATIEAMGYSLEP